MDYNIEVWSSVIGRVWILLELTLSFQAWVKMKVKYTVFSYYFYEQVKTWVNCLKRFIFKEDGKCIAIRKLKLCTCKLVNTK